jgi:hypothetical protein
MFKTGIVRDESYIDSRPGAFHHAVKMVPFVEIYHIPGEQYLYAR